MNKLFFSFFILLAYVNTMHAANNNLTSIKWDHAVNSQSQLHHALNSDCDMIEADIVLGTIKNGTNETLPVMGHPPANTSDISLKTFLETILNFNMNNPQRQKGVKLDFKSTDVFNGSLSILTSIWESMTYPVWLNADIIPGPVNNNTTIPVDANKFFEGSKKFPNAVLSVGWTTNWGQNFTNGAYLESQINNMIESINKNNITKTGHSITYPVRAGIAAQSKQELINLLERTNKTNMATLTIWSSPNDNVDIKKLKDLILTVGVNHVYLDVPEEVSSKLNLGNSASNLFSLGIIGLILFGFLLENIIMHIFH